MKHASAHQVKRHRSISTAIPDDILPEFTTPSLFWRLKYLTYSSWLLHVPFAFWLVETCRPRHIVELGIGEGCSYFALCQAVDELDLGTRCMGVDHWQGDAFTMLASGARDQVSTHNERQYPAFSEIVSQDLVGSESRFADDSIDLLHVDVALTPGVIDSLSHGWSPKLSRQAVVLFHGVSTRCDTPEAAAFLSKIREGHRTFTLGHGEGLMLALLGTDQPENLQRLAAIEPGSPGHTMANQIFQRIGLSHYFEARCTSEADKALRTSLAERDRSHGALRPACLETSEADGNVDWLRNQLATQRKTLNRIRQELSEKASALKVEHRKVAAARTEIAALRRYGTDLETRYLALLESTTWRAMEPARRIHRFLKRRKPPKPFVPRLGAAASFAAPSVEEERRRAQAAEVARCVHHLWGGLSKPAARELVRILEDESYAPDCRFDAAHKLASWHAFHGEHDVALAAIQTIDRVAPARRNARERWMKEGFLHLARGDRDAARAAFAHFLTTHTGRHSPDAALALSNGLADDAARLAQINTVFEQAGFVGIERIDPDRPLALDNIRGRPAARRGGDLGRVSVIMPAYRAADTIRIAIRSLQEQSYDNLEILVVDDASPDETAAVVADMMRHDPRIRLIRQERNGGAYVARNCGLKAATGAFVTTHDTDDWSHPQKIETQMVYLAEHPRTTGICTFWVRVLPTLEMSPNWRIGDRIVHWSHSSFLFRREVVDALGPWDPIRVGADTEFIWRIQAARGQWSVKNIVDKVPLAFALDEESSLTRTKDTHVRTVYFGLRQIYRAVSQNSHSAEADPTRAAAFRQTATPPELLGAKAAPVEIDFLLIGDCTDLAIVAEMATFIDSSEGEGQRIGLFHWPDFRAAPAELCAEYCDLLAREEIRAILPSARIVLKRRYGIFFGSDHAEIDQFPIIEAAAEPPPT